MRVNEGVVRVLYPTLSFASMHHKPSYVFKRFSELDCGNLDKLGIDIILLSGSGIVPGWFINQVSVPILNIHAGVTPSYRGVHGGYRALIEKDYENFGATIHLVNEGLDTGPILDVVRIYPFQLDNFSNIPGLQLRVSLPLVLRQIKSFEAHGFFCFSDENNVASVSRCWGFPGLFGK